MSASYLRSCARKTRYESKDVALKARNAQVASGAWSRNNSHTYRCIQCGGYHNGHTAFVKKGKGRR